MFLIFKDALFGGLWCYVLGLLLSGGALMALYKPGLPIFAEQLSLPGLLVGITLIGYGAYRDMSYAAAGATVTGISLILAWQAPQKLVTRFARRPGLLDVRHGDIVRQRLRHDASKLNGIHCGLLVWLLAEGVLLRATVR